ncbi:TPA: hypothetical protein F8R85_16900 [Legionella pneumophila]|nr:hypothetical protein [Legionella pneumophila]
MVTITLIVVPDGSLGVGASLASSIAFWTSHIVAATRHGAATMWVLKHVIPANVTKATVFLALMAVPMRGGG